MNIFRRGLQGANCCVKLYCSPLAFFRHRRQ
jgi:hypothetical protein